MPRYRIGIFASGNGTNAEAVITYFQHHPLISVEAVFSNNPTAYVIERAKKNNVPVFVFSRGDLYDSAKVHNRLSELEITHIVLAGFLWLLPPDLIHMFSNRIINIHPALLPKYGGKGMYGLRVHQAVKESRETETGITIHEVNDVYDDGRIIFSTACQIDPEDTTEDIARKVHQLEYAHYPRVIEKWINKS